MLSLSIDLNVIYIISVVVYILIYFYIYYIYSALREMKIGVFERAIFGHEAKMPRTPFLGLLRGAVQSTFF